ncbi:MAG: serine hydrolase [Bacteroidales bacterium]|nr:serine hydrolase [Bacteroidales bacterium]
MKNAFAKLKIGLLAMLIYLPALMIAQEKAVPVFIENDLENYVNKALKKWNIPGVSVAIVKDGEVVLIRGFGVRHYQEKKKVDENTLFMIASNTKAFTGHAMALLEFEGKCNLEDKVIDWVPDFKMNDSWVTEHVNLNDVLSHRLGLETFQGDFMYFYSNLTKAEIYEKFPTIIPNNGFREEYGYCNAGFFWAGECIESISGQPWNIFIEDNFIEPLEMSRTQMLSANLEEENNLAAAHTLQDGVLTAFQHTNIDVIGPAAGISSSAEDMSHWLIAQLDSGRYNGKQVIPFEVLKNTRNPRISEGRSGHIFNKSHFALYGLGWGMKDYEGVEVISHSGGILGFVTGVSLVPEINLGIVVLTNSDENWFYEALKWEIIDAYLGLPYRDYSSTYYSFYQRRQKSNQQKIEAYKDTVAQNNKPPLAMDAFTGTYENEMYGTIEIIEVEGKLNLKFEHHPDLKATLEYLNNNRFLCSYYPSRMGTEVFPFTIENGKVTSFSLKVADRLEYTRYEFVKVD